jgi:hypothetical protein
MWPFSLSGSNTVDNLRVIEKQQNLRIDGAASSFLPTQHDGEVGVNPEASLSEHES